MTTLAQFRLILLLISLISAQFVTSAHAVEHALEHHDHSCAMYLAGQESGNATHATGLFQFTSQTDRFVLFESQDQLLSVHFVAFNSRAPPRFFSAYITSI